MPYESSHNFDVKIKKGKGTQLEKKKIVEGKNNKLCFDQRGSYTIIPDSCYKFDQEKFEFNTTGNADKSTFVFKPTHFKIEGKLILKEDDQVKKINMVSYPKSDPKKKEALSLKKSGDALYSFEYYAPSDKDVVIEPILNEESNLLFYPR
jgi:hypothetical protein